MGIITTVRSFQSERYFFCHESKDAIWLHARKKRLANPVGNALSCLHEAFRFWFSRSITNERNTNMKTRLALVLTVLPALVITTARSQVNISGGIQITPPSVQINTPGFGLQINSVNQFYGPLNQYGTWVDINGHGRCWRPNDVGADWRPYSDGSWEWTDAGWYWNSDEPWGWACCHYGSWDNTPNMGWVWIPGTQWAPAWVSWRYSDNYIGWAPCGPGESAAPAAWFAFCNIHNFQNRFTPRNLIVNNRAIINGTREIKAFNRQTVNFDGHQRTIFANKGPGVDLIQRATGHRFTARPITDVVRDARQPQNVRNENRPGENRTPEAQRYNQGQRPDENFNHETPAPTGREQPRQYEQPRQQQPSGQQRGFQQPQERPTVMPPTGREQQRNYNDQGRHDNQDRLNQDQGRQQRPAPEVTPSQRNLAPTGRQNVPSSERQQEAKPSRSPADHAPAQAPPKEEKKDNNQ